MASSHHHLNCSKAQMSFFKILNTILSIPPSNHYSSESSSPSINTSRGIGIDLNLSIYPTMLSGGSESFVINQENNQEGEETMAEAIQEKSVEVSQVKDTQVQSFEAENNEIGYMASESKEEDREGNKGVEDGKEETVSFGDSNSFDLLVEAAKVMSEKDETNSDEEKKGPSYESKSGRTRNCALPYRYRDSVVEPLKRKQKPSLTSNTKKRRRRTLLPSLVSLSLTFSMSVPMEFWGVEVKAGQVVKVDQNDLLGVTIHLSQIALGESKKGKGSEPVIISVKVDDKKFVLGTLTWEGIPQFSLDLYLDSDDFDNVSDFSDSDEDIPLLTKIDGNKVETADPKNDNENESDDDSVDEDDFGSFDELDADSDDEIDSDEDDSEDEEEETPVKKVDQSKKRPNGPASKAPVPAKKAKNATPEKTDGGKKGGQKSTPHPVKKGGKNFNKKGQRS
ncbi:unnamed protein product [Lupinus luteus]|uniref:Nucleoplasmin-like domain-containing protein n=1 Tax=Lupinus luteus TaxID=3873 RepID=A0AAV1W4J6_LUPLU